MYPVVRLQACIFELVVCTFGCLVVCPSVCWSCGSSVCLSVQSAVRCRLWNCWFASLSVWCLSLFVCCYSCVYWLAFSVFVFLSAFLFFYLWQSPTVLWLVLSFCIVLSLVLSFSTFTRSSSSFHLIVYWLVLVGLASLVFLSFVVWLCLSLSMSPYLFLPFVVFFVCWPRRLSGELMPNVEVACV